MLGGRNIGPGCEHLLVSFEEEQHASELPPPLHGSGAQNKCTLGGHLLWLLLWRMV